MFIEAWAQEDPKESDPIKFSASFLAEYNDNRGSASSGKEDTWDFALSPRVDALLDRDRTVVNLHYVPTYRFRDDPSAWQDEHELYHDLGLDVGHWVVPRVKLRLNETFNFTDDTTIQKGATPIRTDTPFLLNRIEGGASVRATPMSNLDIRGRHMVKRYEEEDISRESDEDSISGGLAYWRHISRTLAALGEVDASQFDYGSGDNFDRGFKTVHTGVGAEYILNQNLKGGARLGWQSLDYDADDVHSDAGPFVSLALHGATMPITRLTAGLSYMLRDSDVYPYVSQTHTYFFLDMDWDATRNVTVGALASYGISEYESGALPERAEPYLLGVVEERGLSSIDDLDLNSEERIVSLAASVAYKLGLRTSIKLAQRFDDVDSGSRDILADYNRNTTTLVLTQQF